MVAEGGDAGQVQTATVGEHPAEERALFLAFREHQAGHLESAVNWYREAVRIRPDFPEALNNLGIALKDLRRFDQAVATYRQALKLRPQTPEIWNNIGDALHSLGHYKEAVTHYRRAVALREDYGIAWRNLGDALSETGNRDAAEDCYRKAIAFAPDLGLSSPADAGLREIRFRFARMVKSLEAADASHPAFAKAYMDCGAGVGAPVGCRKDTQTLYDRAAHMWASYATHLSTLLLAMHYEAGTTPEALREAHGEAERFYGRLPRFADHANAPNPERKLRIGYVSPDFRVHSVAYFLAGPFRSHDSNQFEIFCYSNSAEEDEQTAFFREHASGWRSITGMSDERSAELIRRDGVDILVDLSGHTNGNRLAVFARHPAPVQVSWLGYPNTTGLAAIDYRLTDEIIDPHGAADSLSSERLVRLPDGLHCYAPPVEAPATSPLPAAATGIVTFGSFNNLIKVTDEVLDLWAKILHSVPRSRLLVKTKWLGLPQMRERMHRLFESRGIARDRIDLMGQQTSVAEHLGLYSRIDIALDTFPYSGVTTTCEALWMGVPVITIAGKHHAARVGASLLTRLGLPDLVAQTSDGYLDIAIHIADDHERLAALRVGLRSRLSESSVGDEEAFVRQLESAYRVMWRNWCDSATR